MKSSSKVRIRGVLFLFLIISTGYTLYSLSYYSVLHSKQVVKVPTSFEGMDKQKSEFIIETTFEEDGMWLKISVPASRDDFSYIVNFQNLTINLDLFDSHFFELFYEDVDYFSQSFKFEIMIGSESAFKSIWITRFSSLKYMIPYLLVVAIIFGVYVLIGKLDVSTEIP